MAVPAATEGKAVCENLDFGSVSETAPMLTRPTAIRLEATIADSHWALHLARFHRYRKTVGQLRLKYVDTFLNGGSAGPAGHRQTKLAHKGRSDLEMPAAHVERVALSASRSIGIRLSPHRLQHTVCDSIAQCRDADCLQETLGHRSPDKALLYARIADPVVEDDYHRALAALEMKGRPPGKD